MLRIALPAPLRSYFDYLPPPETDGRRLRPGMRVRVPFGRTTRVGLIMALADASVLPASRLRRVLEVLDDEPILTADQRALLAWASGYYHHPIGEVVAAALPAALRSGRGIHPQVEFHYRISPAGASPDARPRAGATRQAQVLEWLRAHPGAAPRETLDRECNADTRTLAALLERGWIERIPVTRQTSAPLATPCAAPELNTAQRSAVEAIGAAFGRFQAFVVDGVTGSGKTEVYLEAVERTLRAGLQALVLIPEIGLTGQTITRFRQRLGDGVAVFHSGLTDQERLCTWLQARAGEARVVIGTRSAVWVPLRHPGLIVVDEEHDLSYKQQDGFRYSARDVAVMRARGCAIPVVLGSATPSLETLHNAARHRYALLPLPERAGTASLPRLEIIDLRGRPVRAGLSQPLLEGIDRSLQRGEQVLLFLNRRGFAPLVLCHHCGWIAECARCDARLTYHAEARELRCHHCDARQAFRQLCAACGQEELVLIGHGTERVVAALGEQFPGARIVRIDSDSTRHKGSIERLLAQARDGEADILVGTQMLSKGHHFPGVTLAAVVDADSPLYSVDFRAPERLAQLLTQVAGRAGRAERPGEVLIQTHAPGHPLLSALLESGYQSFAALALAERRAADLPPYSALALLRAEAHSSADSMRFLTEAREAIGAPAPQILGPVAAPMPRRAGRWRAHLLIQAKRRRSLMGILDAWVPRLDQIPSARRVRWSLDVDPQEML